MKDVRTETVELLKGDEAVAAIVGTAVSQITATDQNKFPRIVIREVANAPAPRFDGKGHEGIVDLRVWFWAKTYDHFFALEAAVDQCMVGGKWTRVSVTEDNYLDTEAAFEKSIVYRKKYFQPNKI
jgi:hypothetical protein